MQGYSARKKNIPHYLVVLLSALFLFSCKTPVIVGTQEYIENDSVFVKTETFRDTIYITNVVKDYVRDSVFVGEKIVERNDTVFIDRTKTVWKVIEKETHDTIYVEHEEKESAILSTTEIDRERVVEHVKEEVKRKAVPWRWLVGIVAAMGIITVVSRLVGTWKRMK